MEKKKVRITIVREYTDGKITKRDTTVQRWTEDAESLSRLPHPPFRVGMALEEKK